VPQVQVVGQWSVTSLNSINSEIDQWIRSQFPALKSATITKAESQVVSGMNYKYTYSLNGVGYAVTVWDQPWLNSRQVTSVEKVMNIGSSYQFNTLGGNSGAS
jgi:hypothetical protein